MNYSQNLMVLTNIELKWFGGIKTIFAVQAVPLASSYKMISFDCLFKGIFF